MKFARWVFAVAGVYGVLVTFPLYFMEGRINADYPPAISHAEYYYGFAGVVLVWQVLFLFIAKNPAAFRPVIPFCIAEKMSMIPIFAVLFPGGRFPSNWIPLMLIDLILGALFWISYRKLRNNQQN